MDISRRNLIKTSLAASAAAAAGLTLGCKKKEPAQAPAAEKASAETTAQTVGTQEVDKMGKRRMPYVWNRLQYICRC